MPIISISKIQHRYGLSENLPQLSAAELGWAIDKRRLFIGNGPTSEGAPAIGNTEILTQFSNLLEIAENSYTYKDSAVGFDAVTGPSVTNPVTRSLQEKLDDFANVRDYGAVGDGITDDTIAINRALKDLFTRATTVSIRRVLYFPAGNYKVSNTITIPPYATLQGEGKNCTIITSTSSSIDAIARTTDSKFQIDASIGTNNAVLPCYVAINDLSFNADSLNINVFIVESTKYTSFRRVGFLGGKASVNTLSGSNFSALKITSTTINHSKNIIFEDCEFSGTEYATILDNDMENIIFDKCTFQNLYTGCKLGENTIGTGTSVYGPRGLRITNSLFDAIYSTAISTYQNINLTSAFNTFLDVGNHLTATAIDPVIAFNGNNSSSICDTFARTNTDNLISPRISYGSSNTVFIESNVGIQVGKRQLSSGGKVTLTDNTTSVTTTGITFTTTQKAQKINYIATRDSIVRNGVLEITATASGITVSDNFTENGSDLGLTLTATVSGSTVTIRYTTTNYGFDVDFSYSVDRNLV